MENSTLLAKVVNLRVGVVQNANDLDIENRGRGVGDTHRGELYVTKPVFLGEDE